MRRRGFTIVELLIVIVVIGILAAITIVAYSGIQNRAKGAAAQAAAAQTSKKLIAYAAENNDLFPPDLATAGITNTTDTGLQYSYSNTVPRTFCITATNNNVSYYENNTTQQNAVIGGCPGHSQNGVTAITNYHRNPGAIGSTFGYSFWSGNSPNVASIATVSASWAQSGSAARITWTTGGDTSGDTQVSLNNGPTYLVAGNTYTVRYRVVANQTIAISPPTLYASSGVYTTLARSHTAYIPLTAGVPQTVWLTFQADSTALAAGLRSILGPSTKTSGNSYELSEAVIYDGTYNSAVGYYSGSSPNWMWIGAVNNSASIGPPL